MTHISMKQATGLAAAVALALIVLSGGASAQTPVANTSYLRDTGGNVPMSAYGLCWHTGFGPVSPNWTEGCDPKLVPASVALPVEAAPVAEPAAAAAAAPAPAPTPMAVPEKLTFDADTLFDFGKSSLRPAGRATLDDFADRIKGIDPEAITTVGHTDRIGSSEYNQRLSEERAQSVKAYLVGIGIAAQRVQTSGRGETDPVTQAGDCPGGKSAKIISCLQPDRRVDIALVGARMPQ